LHKFEKWKGFGLFQPKKKSLKKKSFENKVKKNSRIDFLKE
jgi:hypothetical protein